MADQNLNYEFVLIAGTAGMLLLVCSIVTFIYLYQRKLIKRKVAYQAIENLLRQQELKSAYALLEGQDMERQRIAEDLHDNLGSILVTLSLYAHTLEKTSSEAERGVLTQKIREVAKNAADVTRTIAHKLDSASLRHFGLKAAITDLVQAVNNNGAIFIEAHVDLHKELPTESSINLYRIIQELVNNTLKHARASRAHIEISPISSNALSFIYEDNGIGFSFENANNKGMGLRNLSARAEKLNAQIAFGEYNKNGFSISLEIPYV